MERSVREAIQAVQDNVTSLEQQCRELETEKKQLTSRKDKVTSELERNNRQLQNLQNVRPAFMDEYERLEQELSEEYDMYIQKFRNLDYLERELDRLNQREKAKMEASNRALRRLQRKLREEELKHFRGDEVRCKSTCLNSPWGIRHVVVLPSLVFFVLLLSHFAARG